jgi:hypothetical protein
MFLARKNDFGTQFFDPLSGYPMLKNQFFQLFYFGSKLADFWYLGVFGHEKSNGINPNPALLESDTQEQSRRRSVSSRLAIKNFEFKDYPDQK